MNESDKTKTNNNKKEVNLLIKKKKHKNIEIILLVINKREERKNELKPNEWINDRFMLILRRIFFFFLNIYFTKSPKYAVKLVNL